MKKLVIVLLFWTAPTLAAPSSWIEIPWSQTQAIKQGQNECGPASIFNSFSMSPPEFSASVQGLSGQSPSEKYQNFLRQFATSQSPFGTPYWSHDGTDTAREYFLSRSFLNSNSQAKPLTWSVQHLTRNQGEGFGQLLNRLEDAVTVSLEHGVAPVILLERYDGGFSFSYKPGVDTNEFACDKVNLSTVYTFMGGHFVSVYGIRRIDSNHIQLKIFDQDRFRSDVIDVSENGNFDMGPAYENGSQYDINYTTGAFHRISDATSFETKINIDGKSISSTLLLMQSEDNWDPIGNRPSTWPAPWCPGFSAQAGAPASYYGLFFLMSAQ